jgi:hypothetical protein
MVTYLIDRIRMFTFQSVPMLLIAFENKSVQVFESQNGHFCHEFHFYDQIFELNPDQKNEKSLKDK